MLPQQRPSLQAPRSQACRVCSRTGRFLLACRLPNKRSPRVRPVGRRRGAGPPASAAFRPHTEGRKGPSRRTRASRHPLDAAAQQRWSLTDSAAAAACPDGQARAPALCGRRSARSRLAAQAELPVVLRRSKYGRKGEDEEVTRRTAARAAVLAARKRWGPCLGVAACRSNFAAIIRCCGTKADRQQQQ